MIQSLKPTNQTGKENDMENSNSILEVSVATKAMAFAAALITTAFITTSTLVVFTGSALLGV